MDLRKQAFAGAALALALIAAKPVSATPIEYTFSGTFDGTLGTTNYTDQAFTVTLSGDTTNVTLSSGEYYNTASSATFSIGSTTGSLTGNYNDVVLNPSFNSGTIIFGQGQSSSPFFVGEGLSNSAFGSYTLTTALAQTSGPVSQTAGSAYLTSDGSLVFTNIDSLSFQAQPLPTPLPASFSLFATGLGLMAFYGWRKQQDKA